MAVKIRATSGLSFELNANGSIRRIDHGDILVNLFLGNEVEGGPANIFLRSHGATVEWVPLLGPRSPGTMEVSEAGLSVRGEWSTIRFVLTLALAESAPAWFWHVELANAGTSARNVDLIYAQDLALAHFGTVRMNEFYVSQYVDYTPLDHPERGSLLAVRQNLSMGGRQPWALIGSLGRGVSFATDALQLHGLATRAGRTPQALAAKLPGRRHQHEHSMAVIQDDAVDLAPGASAQRGFFGWFEAHHAAASSPDDLVFADKALALPEASARPAGASGTAPQPTLFSNRPVLNGLDLTDAEIDDLFGSDRHDLERDDGIALSFFAADQRHVVLAAKELKVLRPHGHMLRSGDHLTPDESSLTSTAWMAGVFHSLVTQGHVGINRFLTTGRSYLGLLRSPGQRIFVELDDGYHLLGVPSAFEMTPNSCRWLYKHADGSLEVRSWAATDRHELGVSVSARAGKPRRLLFSHHVAFAGDDSADAVPVRFTRDERGVVVHTLPDTDLGRRFPQGFFRIDPDSDAAIEAVGGDELLFADGRAHGQPFLVIVAAPAARIAFRITGGLVRAPAKSRAVSDSAAERARDEAKEQTFWQSLAGPIALEDGAPDEVARMQRILPWFAHDALIHYLAPRGLEQFSGGGWGTRDVCQGPVEMMLALGKWDPVRDLLVRVFANQNADGDWPQWFMFFERERSIRAGDSHGDIVFWPVVALAEYLLASEDASLLDQVVPFFHPDGEQRAENATIAAHAERALAVMSKRVIAGTCLAAYGHGDWNDSLQPVDPAMRERLCSAWSVTLYFQTVTALAAALRRVGRPERCAALDALAATIRADFQRLLIAGDTLAGFGEFQPGREVEYLLHPSDRRTGIRYRLLPMIHAIINGLLTSEQAKTHVGYMREHLLGADGARLFDRPPEYRGGPQRLFQRAESSSYFGREIGIMYTHAHLRYAESMARYGDAEAFFLALRQAIPIALREVVPSAAPRQANCYYSSSDAAVADRYEASARYADVRAGRIPFEGGWRVYSSGAGIAMRLIHRCFFGLRIEKSALAIDPVMPRRFDGLSASLELEGKTLHLVYRVGARGCGPSALTLNGSPLSFDRDANPYRTGAAVVSMATLRAQLGAERNELVVELE